MNKKQYSKKDKDDKTKKSKEDKKKDKKSKDGKTKDDKKNYGDVSVNRDGKITTLSSKKLVVGDIVELTPGMQVPADLRILVSNGIQVAFLISFWTFWNYVVFNSKPLIPCTIGGYECGDWCWYWRWCCQAIVA